MCPAFFQIASTLRVGITKYSNFLDLFAFLICFLVYSVLFCNIYIYFWSSHNPCFASPGRPRSTLWRRTSSTDLSPLRRRAAVSLFVHAQKPWVVDGSCSNGVSSAPTHCGLCEKIKCRVGFCICSGLASCTVARLFLYVFDWFDADSLLPSSQPRPNSSQGLRATAGKNPLIGVMNS